MNSPNIFKIAIDKKTKNIMYYLIAKLNGTLLCKEETSLIQINVK